MSTAKVVNQMSMTSNLETTTLKTTMKKNLKNLRIPSTFFWLWPDTRLIYDFSVCVANKHLKHPGPLRQAILRLPRTTKRKRKPRKEIMEANNRL